MKTNYFKDLLVWQKAIQQVQELYALAEQFPKGEEYNLKQQLKRAATSIPLNIAEGKNRSSGKDFARFLDMAIGSTGEVEAILVLSEELEMFKVNRVIYERITEISKMLQGLRSKLLKK